MQLIHDIKVIQLNLHVVEAAQKHQFVLDVLYGVADGILTLGLEIKAKEEKKN